MFSCRLTQTVTVKAARRELHPSLTADLYDAPHLNWISCGPLDDAFIVEMLKLNLSSISALFLKLWKINTLWTPGLTAVHLI